MKNSSSRLFLTGSLAGFRLPSCSRNLSGLNKNGSSHSESLWCILHKQARTWKRGNHLYIDRNLIKKGRMESVKLKHFNLPWPHYGILKKWKSKTRIWCYDFIQLLLGYEKVIFNCNILLFAMLFRYTTNVKSCRLQLMKDS